MKALFLTLLLFVNILASSQTQFWEPINGPCGGMVSSMAVSRNNHVFAGVAGSIPGGIFRSTDAGAQWTITHNSPIQYVDHAALAINQYGHIFASSGGNGWGIFRSTDDGGTWTQNNAQIPWPDVHSFSVNKAGHVFAGLNYGGVFRSTDNGDNWEPVNNGMSGLNVRGLAIDSHGYVFAATWDSGMFCTTQNGDSWMPVETGIVGGNMSVLAIDSLNRLFVAMYDGRLFRSNDSVSRWTQINNGLPLIYFYALAVGKNNHVYAATEGYGLFRSTDGGDSWLRIDNGLPYTRIASIAVDSVGHIFAGTFTNGIFRSSDNGETWAYTSRGLIPHGVNIIRLDSKGQLFVASEGDAGAFISTDNGDNWTPIDNGMVGTEVWGFEVSATDYLYACTPSSAYRSTDGGKHWQTIGGVDGLPIAGFVVAPGGDMLSIGVGTLYAGLYRSTNEGTSWTRIFSSENIEAAAVRATGEICVAASMMEYPPYPNTWGYRSTDSGATWTSADLGVLLGGHALAFNSSGNIFIGGDQGLLRSTDNGENWTFLSRTLQVYALGINRIDHLFVGTEYEVSRSTDNGETWSQLNAGLPPDMWVNSFAFDSPGRLLAGTRAGLFRTNESTTSTPGIRPPLPQSIQLFPNYPNPFNPSTTIKFELPHSSRVSLKVYNTLGQEVATLVNGDQEAGYHEVKFDVSGLASGVYLYRLTAGSFVQTRKLSLVK